MNNPVLPVGQSGNWDDRAVWSPHVIKVDQTYKMWFTADQYGGLRRIGYAESVDGINWTKHPEPVIEEGDPDVFLYYTESPTVSFDGEKYHMWYSRENEDLYHQIDYAVSSNGISWSKHPENPVIKTGADSDWYRAIYHPNVIMNNDNYKMWFVGGRGDWKFGYAEDFSNLVHADSVIIETYVKPNSDPFNILGRILSPEGHALTAKAFILSDDESSKDSVELFDDGSNNDGAAGDGIYGGYWPVADEKNYNVGIKTVDQITGFTRNGLNWNITDRFTTKGPVKFESLENASNDTEPYPGGRIKYNITLGNNGITDTIKNVNIILIDNEFIKNTTTGTPKWGDIPPGENLTSWSRPYALSFADSSTDTTYSMAIEITSNGEMFWYDTLKFQVVVGIDDEVSSLPDIFALEQNYPNPFNPTTTIKYSIPVNSKQ